MNFTQTFSREQLQNLPAVRLECIKKVVENRVEEILVSASHGYKSQILFGTDLRKCGTPFALSYIPTIPDLVEGFKEKFPGCKVSTVEFWTELASGEQGKATSIKIDWS